MPYLSCSRCFLTGYSDVPSGAEDCPRCGTSLDRVAGNRFEPSVGDGRVRFRLGEARPVAPTPVPPIVERAS